MESILENTSTNIRCVYVFSAYKLILRSDTKTIELSFVETDSETDLETDSKPRGYIVLCRTFHIAQTRTQIPTLYFCIGQESESESVPVSESGNVL